MKVQKFSCIAMLSNGQKTRVDVFKGAYGFIVELVRSDKDGNFKWEIKQDNFKNLSTAKAWAFRNI
jgi:23S rRNA U2552 (ribose-2'-O)-methylase RlmE/FtsJ